MSHLRFHVFACWLVCLLASTGALVNGSAGGDDASMLPFDFTEQLIYEGEFSKLMLRHIDVAEIRFTADRISTEPSDKVEAQPTTNFRFTVEAISKGWFRKLFGIHFRYLVQSFVEPRSLSVQRTTTIDEQGQRVRASETIYNRASGNLVWTERDLNDTARPPRVVTSPLTAEATSDLASALYFLRTQPLVLSERFDLMMSDSGRVYRVPVEVVEKKRIKTLLGEVPTIRVNIGIFGDERPVSGRGQMSMWFTDDRRRVPVRAQISSEMGTLDITLKRITSGQQADAVGH